MRKQTSKRRWIARGRLGRVITHHVAVQHELRGPWFDEFINMDAAFMTQYNMNRFLYMWKHHALQDDLTWRGYAITGHIGANAAKADGYIERALKALGLGYAGEHALGHFTRLYDVPAHEARYLLAAWWVWSRLASGVRVPGVQKRAVEGPQEGSGATTLA